MQIDIWILTEVFEGVSLKNSCWKIKIKNITSFNDRYFIRTIPGDKMKIEFNEIFRYLNGFKWQYGYRDKMSRVYIMNREHNFPASNVMLTGSEKNIVKKKKEKKSW